MTEPVTCELIVRGSNAAIMAVMQHIMGIAPTTAPGGLTITGTINPAAITTDEDGPANPNAPTVDNTGLPWDDRIHSKNKGLNENGTWRKKRGVDAAMVTAVEAELRGKMQPGIATNAPPPPPPQFTPPTMQVAPPPMMAPAAPPPPQYQMPPGYPQPQQTMAPPPPTNATPQLTLNSFMMHLNTLFPKRDASGQPVVHAQTLAECAQYLSQQLGRTINHITEMGDDPHALNLAVNWFNSQGKWNVP